MTHHIAAPHQIVKVLNALSDRKLLCCTLSFLIASIFFQSTSAQDELVVIGPSPVMTFRVHQANSQDLNFAFENFQTKWFTSQKSLNDFWKEFSRNEPAIAPTFPVDWSTTAVLGVFWKSRDGLIRIPSFFESEVVGQQGENPVLKLRFLLNEPCFGIITDESPAAFMSFRLAELKYSKIEIESEATQSLNCMDDPLKEQKTKALQ